MAQSNNEEEIGVVLPYPVEGRGVIVRFKREARVRRVGANFESAPQADVSGVNNCISNHPGCTIDRLFAQTEDALDRDVASLEGQTRVQLPPLSGYFHLTAVDDAQAEALRAELQDNSTVDEVYVEPQTVPAIFVEPTGILLEEALPATIDFIAQQGYLDVGPGGVDARAAWTVSGGRGDKVQVIDIEGAWNFSHEDLIQNQGGLVGGTATANRSWENHGTAVQGEIAGDDNQFGVVGIAPEAKFSGVSIFGTENSSAKAIKTAADKLKKGDIILIELHRPGPNATGVGQVGFIPIEWWSADFDAIKYATAKGIIVIEAAGNGGQNLDDEIYDDRFNRSNRDSGAILVGAGAPPSGNFGSDRSRLAFSNYGSLVDAQAWGKEVTTTGYGDLQGGTDRNKLYTRRFDGTSSASPIVVGAVACLQSIQVTRGGAPLTNLQVRDILRSTGAPQTDGIGRPSSQRIGNRPDLKEAMNQIASAVTFGVAARYWDETVAYPTGSNPKLWLLVDNSWKQLENPSQGVKDMVQRAFLGSGSSVRVWYNDFSVVGLAVEGSHATV